MKTKNTFKFNLITFLMISSALFAQLKEYHNTYMNIGEINIALSPISSYFITISEDQNVHLKLMNADDKTVQYNIRVEANVLYLSEKDLLYQPNRPTPKDIYSWDLRLPKNIVVNASGGYGKIEAKLFEGDISVRTAAGIFSFADSKGKFHLSAASSNFEIERCEGIFDISTGGNGDIDADDIVIKGESNFLTNGGDAEIILAKTPMHNVTIKTGTGDGILDYKGNSIVGSFRFSAEKDKGEIVSPFSFDKQTTYKDELKNISSQKDFGKTVDYLLMAHTINSASPEIKIKTNRGRAILKK